MIGSMCQRDVKFLAQSSPGGGSQPSGRPERRLVPAAAALAAVLVSVACASPPEQAGPDGPSAAPDPGSFSAARAWSHLEELSEIGERQTGTRGASRARAYLSEALEDAGVTVEERVIELPAAAEDEEPVTATHLVGILPGESDDRFMLAASYDTRAIPGLEFVGANASASGAAVVLELARALSERPRPYTLMFVLLDGDALPAMTAGSPFPGSRALAEQIAASESGFSAIRLAVFFQQVGDVDLSIARDLRSHHVYREFFWEAAALVGKGIYFPAAAPVESVDGGHLEFIERGLPRTVLISDPRFGGPDVPGRHAGTERDTLERCSRDSLGVVGEVTLEALDRIADRLARIDRFRASPLADPIRDSEAAPAQRAAPTPEQTPVGE